METIVTRTFDDAQMELSWEKEWLEKLLVSNSSFYHLLSV